MHNPELVLANKRHKLLWDFDIQTDHLISARRPYFIIINKKERTCRTVDFAVPADHRVKLKESEKKDKYLDLARGLKKQGSDGYTYCNWCSLYSHKRIGIGTGGLGNERTSGDQHYCWNRSEYQEKSWRLEKTWLHSDSSGKPSANAGVENSQMSKIII